jgi:formyl-CoA transferase
MILDVTAGDGLPLKVPGIVPKLSATPGRIARPAPRLGQHDDALSGAHWPHDAGAS